MIVCLHNQQPLMMPEFQYLDIRSPEFKKAVKITPFGFAVWLTCLLVVTLLSLPIYMDDSPSSSYGIWFWNTFFTAFSGVLPIFLFQPVMAYFCWRWPFMPGCRLKTLAKLALLFLIYVPLLAFGVDTCLKIVGWIFPWFLSKDISVGVRAIYSIPYFFAPFLLMAFITYTYIAQLYAKNERETALMFQSELNAARVETLQNQLQPHFLFNALNGISATMYEDVKKADKMLSQLGQFLRTTHQVKDRPFVCLREEINCVRQFLDIASLRFGERLTIAILVPSELDEFMVPSMLLQPLVENAVKHRFEESSGACSLTVAAQLEGEYLCIEVLDKEEDNIAQPTVELSNLGGGLENVKRRLEFLYPEQYQFELCSLHDGVTRASIRIPADRLIDS